ncbi:MAG: DUF29 domain-containing protein [Terricaulis sp.]
MADDQRPGDLYERDFYLWTQAQAEALRAEAQRRAGGSNAVDWEHVAEEIEDMGGRDVRECYSRAATIIEHLFKLAWSQQKEPVGGWRITILTQRRDLDLTLTPSIRRKLEEKLEELHVRALVLAEDAFKTNEPTTPRDASLRWTLEQILGEVGDPLA